MKEFLNFGDYSKSAKQFANFENSDKKTFLAELINIYIILFVITALILIIQIYILGSLCYALDGNTETVVHRKMLIRCFTVYAGKCFVGYTSLGVVSYFITKDQPILNERDPLHTFTNNQLIQSIEYFVQGAIGGGLSLWWRNSFVRWVKELERT